MQIDATCDDEVTKDDFLQIAPTLADRYINDLVLYLRAKLETGWRMSRLVSSRATWPNIGFSLARARRPPKLRTLCSDTDDGVTV